MEIASLLGRVPELLMPLPFTSTKKLHFRSNTPFLPSGSNVVQHRQGRRISINPFTSSIGRSRVLMIKNVNEGGDKRNFRTLKAAVGASLALACALSIFGCRWKLMNPRTAMAGPRVTTSKGRLPGPERSAITPKGGETALKSLLKVCAVLTSSRAEISRVSFDPRDIPDAPAVADVDMIKMVAARWIREGKENDATKLLEKYETEPEIRENIKIARVEILICQGKYGEAEKLLRSMDIPASDPRGHLYKAIVYTMLDKLDEAYEHWQIFSQSVGKGIDPRK